MLPERRTAIVVLSALALALGSWWLRQGMAPEPAALPPLPPHTPDYWAENLRTLETDPQGRPRRRLTAERLEHFPDDQSTELQRPTLWLLEPGRPPWRVRSERGWRSPDGDLILLLGEVHLDRAAAEGIEPVHLVTRDLRVRPDQEYVETAERVQIVSGPQRVESTGLQAWLRSPPRIKLLADVRGHYEVSP